MEKNPSVKIAGVVGTMSLAIVAVICIFARSSVWVAAPIVGALAAMGVALGYFAKGKAQN